ncbi:phage baseplate protein [Parasulfuritortus cantonensis]|uniref:Phage baseplate protein n=1 Tax=Parasulfuritortus cantonensis TaxID=2528202 RepID=A0A4R1B4C9_9PROT|nr:GPW/gp25 family protein [Parasulfuritortus cantonensis]TCJ12320.1 phage baseplate protein [Parasulfuritortus cantonensis]
MARRLVDPPYLAFPFAVAAGQPELASRSEHVRDQIEQVLFTLPGERVFRPEFGAGIQALVFEPNDTPLWQITKRRLLASLAEALQGEVDPKSIEVTVSGDDAELTIAIAYTLAAVGHRESQLFSLGGL